MDPDNIGWNIDGDGGEYVESSDRSVFAVGIIRTFQSDLSQLANKKRDLRLPFSLVLVSGGHGSEAVTDLKCLDLPPLGSQDGH